VRGRPRGTAKRRAPGYNREQLSRVMTRYEILDHEEIPRALTHVSWAGMYASLSLADLNRGCVPPLQLLLPVVSLLVRFILQRLLSSLHPESESSTAVSTIILPRLVLPSGSPPRRRWCTRPPCSSPN
jgi:hypothetical protein